jgi:hypothetical protein
MKHKAPALAAMVGMWRRSLIIHADGSRDATAQVRWLQAQRLFVDLRQDAELPDFMHLDCLDDLGPADCAQLARQEGFAGHFGFDGEYFEWQRLIDFQPRGACADVARLWWEDENLIETGRDVPYVEYWQRDPTVVTRPQAGMWLRDPHTGALAVALLVGTVFMFARDRPLALPAGSSLTECVTGAGSLAQARGMLDCEVTLGSVGSGGNLILASTHPWRVSEYFLLECQDSTVSTQDVDPAGRRLTRRWEVIEADGDPASAWERAGGQAADQA